jgi:hypothetical protein
MVPAVGIGEGDVMHPVSSNIGKWFKVIFMSTLGLFWAVVVNAMSYEEPKERVILTVTGNISPDIPNGVAKIGYDTLEKIGVKELTTRTFYSKKRYKFSGILVRDLLAYVGAKGKTLEFTALDDYRINIPISDYQKYDVLLVFKLDGKRLSIRDRGPTRIIYPIEKHPELNDKKYVSRYVWQIKGVKVK